MALSMTAFARVTTETPSAVLTWELRAVNHRYLELGLKMPEDLRALELPIRERIAARVGRGKLDAQLRVERRERAEELSLDADFTRRVLRLGEGAAALARAEGVPLAPWNLSELLRWPGVLAVPATDLEAEGTAVLALLDQALAEFVAAREREGARLAGFMEERLTAMDGIVAQLRTAVPQAVQTYRERLRARVAEFKAELDPQRLEQEVLLFAQKSDVGEELDRLQSHLTEVRGALKQKGPLGRRLDFLMQEFNREANTLGSKAPDIRFTNAAVDLKVLIEQLREQVQNIE